MLYFENLYISEQLDEVELKNNIIKKVRYKNLLKTSGETHLGNGLLLTVNKGSFVKPCPGQKGSICCGYWVVEWGMGCPFGCEYCIIQNYAQSGDLTLYLNWDKCMDEIKNLIKAHNGSPLRLGTGQFGDPLAIEDLFPLNREIISLTQNSKNFTLEIKTKSCNIGSLLTCKDATHVTLSFSLNPQSVINRYEHRTASLKERIFAATKAAEATGCSLAFHFDPIIPVTDWRSKYTEVFELMSENLPKYKTNWISLGTFRFPKGFENYVEKHHPKTDIFFEEFYPTSDGKIRYFRPFREEIYNFAHNSLKKIFPDTPIYMCMETADLWQRVTDSYFTSNNLKQMLDSSILKDNTLCT